MTYYETKLCYTKEVGDGKMQKTTEYYIVRALSYADAEMRIIEQQSAYTFNGEMDVDIKKVKYAEIVPDSNPNADKWYKIKVVFVSMDESGESTKEKKISHLMLVQAFDVESAFKNLKTAMSSSPINYDVALIQETKIMDYYDFSIADVADQAAEEPMA